jgi:hypothetical protein
MIEFTRAYIANGKTYATLKEAQVAELAELFAPHEHEALNSVLVARVLVDNADKFMNVLTTTESSRPRARSANGGTKKRKPKTPAVISAENAA